MRGGCKVLLREYSAQTFLKCSGHLQDRGGFIAVLSDQSGRHSCGEDQGQEELGVPCLDRVEWRQAIRYVVVECTTMDIVFLGCQMGHVCFRDSRWHGWRSSSSTTTALSILQNVRSRVSAHLWVCMWECVHMRLSVCVCSHCQQRRRGWGNNNVEGPSVHALAIC